MDKLGASDSALMSLVRAIVRGDEDIASQSEHKVADATVRNRVLAENACTYDFGVPRQQ
jgi:hypothetical protein